MPKGSHPANIRWPLEAKPVLRRAGWYPFQFNVQGRGYEHPTAALHQHFYEGVIHYQGGPSVELMPGDITYSPPDTVTTYELKSEGYHWCLHFDPVPSGAGKEVTLPLHLSPGTSGTYATEKMRLLTDLYSRVSAGGSNPLLRALIPLALQELILWVASRVGDPRFRIGAKLEEGLSRARALLDGNYRNPPGPEEIAQEVGLNRNYLAASFKKQFGLTMDAYLLRRRLDVASHLLASTRLAVKEVAYETGIPDAQYFNKQFRRIFGVSPTVFRQSRAGRKSGPIK